MKLKFTATDNVVTQINRSVELNVKRDKNGKVTTSFKTLDSTLIRYNENGKKTTLSSRCAEIDKEMLATAGVSKAVLTNVIFCHQEDNCWPLSEGKILKEKFDQIFGSIGYVKALAKIKAYRAKKVGEIKTLDAVKDKYAEIREQKGKNEKDRTRHTRVLESLRLEKTNLETKLKPIEKELEGLNQEESGFTEVRSKVAKLKGQLHEKVRSVTDLENQVKEKFSGTLSELDEKEAAYRNASSGTGKADELPGKVTRIQKLVDDIRTQDSRRNALLILKGKIDHQEENFTADLGARDDFVTRLSNELNVQLETEMDVDGGAGQDGDSKFNKLLSCLKEKEDQLTREFVENKSEAAAGTKQLADRIEELKISKAKAQQTIKMKEETQQKRESEMKELLAKVAKVETTTGTIVDQSDEILVAVHALKSKLQDESDAFEVEGKVSSLKLTQCELQEQIMDLKKMNHQMVRECVSSVSEIRKEVKQLDDDLVFLQNELVQKIKDQTKSESTEAAAIQKNKEIISKLRNLQESVTRHAGTGEKSAKINGDIADASSKIQAMKDEKALLESEVAAIQKEVAESEVLLRNFSDNRRLLNLSEEIASVNEKVLSLEKNMPAMDMMALERKKQDLNKKGGKIREEIGSVIGRMHAAQQEVRRLETELQLAKYQTVEKDFKKAMVDLVTQELLVDDLNKYYKILDQAVSKFHIRRMEQINQLIGHYWRTTYQGTDIKAIKIVCDGDEERSADKRRSFNYRVVMVKNNSEMDMRGRCSAGQKVLASLVIRIALAQVFCVNCSILTLDEPTTNLDKANVEALAKAICSIVEDQKGKIQIVIITHDAEFLKYLNEEFSEFYYEVCKGENGFSRISRKFLRDRE